MAYNGGGWIGVDFDGTICRYAGWEGAASVGEPVPEMVHRVKDWLARGFIVKILTARVSDPEDAPIARAAIEAWCLEHVGQVLEVTCTKDYAMIELWDDRAIAVKSNTGVAVGWSRVNGPIATGLKD